MHIDSIPRLSLQLRNFDMSFIEDESETTDCQNFRYNENLWHNIDISACRRVVEFHISVRFTERLC